MKKWIFKFGILALVTFHLESPQAFAYYSTDESSCSSIDFRNTFPLATRNQEGLSWCFAHSAADYLQYTFQIPVQLSAADIAINYSKSNWSRLVHFFTHLVDGSLRGQPPQTGIAQAAIKLILPQGYCPESALPSDFWNRVDSATGEQKKEEILQSILDMYSLQKDIQAGIYSSPADLPFYFSFLHVSREDFFNLLQNSSHNKLLLKLRNQACSLERKPFPGNPISVNFKLRGRHVFQRMNDSFDRSMPVTVDFFASLLKDYESRAKDITSFHTVLLYGRKFDPATQQCTYLLKNSWGTECTRYDPRIECEHGYLWIAENKLFPNMTSQLIINRE